MSSTGVSGAHPYPRGGPATIQLLICCPLKAELEAIELVVLNDPIVLESTDYNPGCDSDRIGERLDCRCAY